VLVAAVAALASLTACATNPATGQSQLSFFTEAEEIVLGAEVDREFLGNSRRYDDARLDSWVAALGHRLAAVSERPDLPWSFHVTDDEIVNAFALPGGRIYVTRGLLAHLDSEAELAGVLGHEIGHVTARHSVHGLSRQIAWTLGVAAGLAVFDAGEAGELVSSLGLGLMFLKFDRDQERQADQLGVRDLQRAGFDPHGVVDALRVLQQVSQAQDDGWLPAWLSTHPDPDKRWQRLADEMQLGPRPPTDDSEIAAYLARIDGLVYGADPRNGTLVDSVYVQQRDGFQMSFPAGWEIEREGQTLSAESAAEDSLLMLLPQTAESVPGAVASFGGEDGITVDKSWDETLGGLPARVVDFRVTVDEEAVWGKAAFVQTPGRVVAVVAVAAYDAWPRHGQELQSAMRSIGRVSPAKRYPGNPRRLRVVSLPRAMDAREIARRYSPQTDPATIALLNQVRVDQPLAAGRRVKIVENGG
jgi:predicted Zn-dependent protease